MSKITEYSNELYCRNEIRKTEQRHSQRVVEEKLVKFQKEVTEQQRIEMNRRMNKPGQNVDRMA